MWISFLKIGLGMSVFHQYIQNICKVEPLVIKNLQLNHINFGNNLWSYTPGKKIIYGELFLTNALFDICLRFLIKISQSLDANYSHDLASRRVSVNSWFTELQTTSMWAENITDAIWKEMWPPRGGGAEGEKTRGWEVVIVLHLEGVLEICSAGNLTSSLGKSPLLLQSDHVFSFLPVRPNLKIISTLTVRYTRPSDILRWGKAS